MKRELIVNADDFGFADCVNCGIIEGHACGVVSSTSVLVNMSAAKEGLRKIRREAPKLGVGLHLNITAGKPLSSTAEISSLISGSGDFHSMVDVVFQKVELNPDHVYIEFQRQLERFCEMWGDFPDHLDSHHFITLLSPHCYSSLLRLTDSISLPIRTHDLATADAVFHFAQRLQPPGLHLERWPINPLLPKTANTRSPDRLELGFYGNLCSPRALLEIIDSLPYGITEMMCHPGLLGDLGETYPSELRYQELEALTDPSVREHLIKNNVQLISFNDLPTSPSR